MVVRVVVLSLTGLGPNWLPKSIWIQMAEVGPGFPHAFVGEATAASLRRRGTLSPTSEVH